MTKLLIVDSDVSARDVLGDMISKAVSAGNNGADLEILSAASSEDGLAQYDKFSPDVVIVDLLMAQTNDFGLCKAIRDRPGGERTKIIVVSSSEGDQQGIEDFRRIFQASVFAKPHQMSDLAKSVSSFFVEGTGVTRTRAPSVSPTATSGKISDTPVPTLLLKLHKARTTGILELRRGTVEKQVVLVFGFPHAVTSNVRSETLGQLLLNQNLITDEILQQALEYSKKEDIRFGQALIALDAIHPEQLGPQLNTLARLKLTNCLRWDDGEWNVKPPSPTSHSRGDAINMAEVIVEGLRSTFRASPLPSHLGEISRSWISINDRGLTLAPAIKEQLGVDLESISGEFCPAELSDNISQEVSFLAALDILHQCRGIETADSPQDEVNVLAEGTLNAKAPISKADLFNSLFSESLPLTSKQPQLTGTIPVALPDDELDEDGGLTTVRYNQSGGLSENAQAKRNLLKEFLRAQDLDYYRLLRVEPEASPATISAAVAERKSNFAPEYYGRFDLGKEFSKLEDLHAAYEKAASTLLDDVARKKYDAELSGSTASASRPTRINGELAFRKAEGALSAGKISTALDNLRTAVSASPNESQYRAALGWAEYVAGGRNVDAADKARPHLNQALVMNPDCASAHEYKGLITAELGIDDQEAIAHLEEALRSAPKSSAALAAVERLRAMRGEYRPLEQLYRKLIFLTEESDKNTLFLLWKKLGSLCRDELSDLDAASAAFEIALRYKPGDAAIQRSLSKLRVGSSVDLVTGDSPELEPLFITASIRVAQGDASTEELATYQKYRQVFSMPESNISPATWTSLLHPHDESGLEELFSMLEPVINHRPNEEALRELEGGVELETELPDDISTLKETLSKFLRVDSPAIYARADYDRDIHVAATTPLNLIAGDQVLSTPERSELVFRLARALTYARPGRAVAGSVPGRVLRQHFLAAWAVAQNHTEYPGVERELLERIWRLDTNRRDKIVEKIQSLTQHQNRIDLTRWQTSLARTADRLGLIACGDLPSAVRFVRHSSSNEAASELISFAESTTYLKVRRDLGLSVGVGSITG